MEITNKRIIVTGGLGFIGSHLVQKLLDDNCDVSIYDNYDDFYPGKEENALIIQEYAKQKGMSLEIIRGDIRDQSKLSTSIRGCDAVFHLAAQAGVRYCNEDPIKANLVNVDGTINVLLASKQHNVKKIVCASSSSIFGDPRYLPIDEAHPTNPNSPYGVSKLAAEQYCRVFAKVYGMNVTMLRYFSVYGPRGRPDQVIYAFADKISKGMSPLIFGDGEQTRDFTYVSDVVDATLLAMMRDQNSGESFNIGHGSRITINQLVEKVARRLTPTKPATPRYEEQSKGDFPDTEANNEKATTLLGWKPHVDVDEGLDLFLDWFLKAKASP